MVDIQIRYDGCRLNLLSLIMVGIKFDPYEFNKKEFSPIKSNQIKFLFLFMRLPNKNIEKHFLHRNKTI